MTSGLAEEVRTTAQIKGVPDSITGRWGQRLLAGAQKELADVRKRARIIKKARDGRGPQITWGILNE